MKSQDSLQPVMIDGIINITFLLLICVSVMTVAKVQEVAAVSAPEIAKPVGLVKTSQGLSEKKITLLKNGTLSADGKPLGMAEVSSFVANASGVLVDADKEAAVGSLLELQQAVLKSGCDMQILIKEPKP